MDHPFAVTAWQAPLKKQQLAELFIFIFVVKINLNNIIWNIIN